MLIKPVVKICVTRFRNLLSARKLYFLQTIIGDLASSILRPYQNNELVYRFENYNKRIMFWRTVEPTYIRSGIPQIGGFSVYQTITRGFAIPRAIFHILNITRGLLARTTHARDGAVNHTNCAISDPCIASLFSCAFSKK
jgi:hypothetical protein